VRRLFRPAWPQGFPSHALVLRGLDQAADLPGRAGKRDLLIVSLDQEDSLREGGRRIRVVPAWKWLD
jgi:hypothetical protein